MIPGEQGLRASVGVSALALWIEVVGLVWVGPGRHRPRVRSVVDPRCFLKARGFPWRVGQVPQAG